MFSVFPNKQDLPPSEMIMQAKNCAGSIYERYLLAGSPNEPLWMLKAKAIDVLMWINRKILYELPFIDYRTVDVRLRIATGMLNNLERDNILPKDICILYHQRLVKRVKEMSSAIETEGLPF